MSQRETKHMDWLWGVTLGKCAESDTWVMELMPGGSIQGCWSYTWRMMKSCLMLSA